MPRIGRGIWQIVNGCILNVMHAVQDWCTDSALCSANLASCLIIMPQALLESRLAMPTFKDQHHTSIILQAGCGWRMQDEMSDMPDMFLTWQCMLAAFHTITYL